MKFIRKKTWWKFQVLPVFIAAVLIYLSLAPSDHDNSSSNKTASPTINSFVKEHFPVSQYERVYFLTGYPENEMLFDLVNNLTITRSFRDFKGMVIRIFNILLPIAGFGVFIYCLGYFIRRKKQNISVMAISMGGHAPPMILRNNLAF